MNMPILSVNKMSKIYPGVIALDKVDFENIEHRHVNYPTAKAIGLLAS